MSALIEAVGGTPGCFCSKRFTQVCSEVADCAITSPTSGNTVTGLVTTHYFPLASCRQWSLYGLDTWNKFSADKKAELTAAFKKSKENSGILHVTILVMQIAATPAANAKTSRNLI